VHENELVYLGFLSSVIENIDKTIKQIDETIETMSTRCQDDATDKIEQSNCIEFQAQREKLLQFVARVELLRNSSESFHFEINDPSGNSFIENPKAPYRDEQMTIKKFRRTPEQNEFLCITDEDTLVNDDTTNNSLEISKDEILNFLTNCPDCHAPCDTRMKVTTIPHFKEIILMATTCDACGHKCNEVKSGTGIASQGVRYRLVMTDPTDLDRDILVSETSSFALPDLDFELSSSKSIGGRFTTLEGIFTTLKTQLASVIMPFSSGDSRDSNSDQSQMTSFIDIMSEILAGEKLVTIVLDDPAGNCYLQNIYAPEPDPNLTVEHYERDEEQNELLGLTDMNVDNYDQS
jgi:zinc finger protein